MVDALRGELEAGLTKLEAEVQGCPGTCRDECIRATSALASVLQHAGRFEDALVLRRQALAEHAEQDGPDALSTAGYRLHLASTLFSVGAYDESQRELERAALVFETLAGPGHAALGDVESLRSAILLQGGDTAAAVVSARRAVDHADARSDLLPEIAIAWRRHLAYALSEHGDLSAAAAEYERLLDDVPDPGDSRARIVLGRAELRLAAGDRHGAVDDCRAARAMLEQHAPWDEYNRLASYSYEATALTEIGACDAALEVLTAGLEWADEAGAADVRASLEEDRVRWSARCLPNAP
jgi:tetratricopeptide (TPR) repeat protein